MNPNLRPLKKQKKSGCGGKPLCTGILAWVFMTALLKPSVYCGELLAGIATLRQMHSLLSLLMMATILCEIKTYMTRVERKHQALAGSYWLHRKNFVLFQVSRYAEVFTRLLLPLPLNIKRYLYQVKFIPIFSNAIFPSSRATAVKQKTAAKLSHSAKKFMKFIYFRCRCSG